MISTPKLIDFNIDGGTLYVFPSASRDLTRTFVSSDYEFKFSHFACLKLPEFKEGPYNEASEESEEYNKGLYLQALTPNHEGYWNNGFAIKNNLQNYVMNFETAILNGMGMENAYDNDILTSPSEKVFFNWLQKVGGIKFDDSSSSEKYNGSEEDRTVQYIGNLDIMNSVEVNGDVFEELYIYIPSSAGASTNVYFRRGGLTDDKNYLDREYVLNLENIIGSEDSENIQAFYDYDHTYVGDVGYTIDFRDTVYDGGEGIDNMNAKSQKDFEFNAILIYYDLLQKTKTPGVRRVSTNLYGILFVSGIENNQLELYPKKKEKAYSGGNSFGFKIDIKIDTTSNSQSITIPDSLKEELQNHTAGLSLYEKSLVQLQKCIDLFYTQKIELTKLSERVSTLENLVTGIDSIKSLRSDINKLYNLFDDNLMVDTSALLGLINENSKKLDNIMNGGKDLKLQYDTDVLQPGRGIGMVKSLNKVIISSEDRYSINDVSAGTEENPINTGDNSVKECNIPLRPGENFAVIYINDTGLCESKFNINIDDSEFNWEIGQSMKICFSGDLLNFGDNGILEIRPTDGVVLSIAEFDDGASFIELVCVGENKFVYLIR